MLIKMRSSNFSHAKTVFCSLLKWKGKTLNCIKIFLFGPNGSLKLVQTGCISEKSVQPGSAPVVPDSTRN